VTGAGLRVGVDLDNTIVCYDRLFHDLAVERGLIGDAVAPTKTAVRARLCAAGREDVWTELQGEAYGPRMRDAMPFDGVREFFAACARTGVDAYIVSHRSRHPYAGPPHDLHESARRWLAAASLPCAGADATDRAFLEIDRDAKARRIAELGCTHFVDDLADFLAEPSLPASMVRVHFDPAGASAPGRAAAELVGASSWRDVSRVILGEAPA